jgi:hypothetical protein
MTHKNPYMLGSLKAPKTPEIVLDLADEQVAFALAKRIANRTGLSVRVRDVNGSLLGTFHPGSA